MNKFGLAILAAATLGTVMPSASLAQSNLDLVGIWAGAQAAAERSALLCKEEAALAAFAANPNERTGYAGATGSQRWITFEQDCSIRRRGAVNKPVYKPEYWREVELHDYYANAGGDFVEYADPVWQNYPNGTPRAGLPSMITTGRDENELVMLYGGGNLFRVVQTGTAPDCPTHDPVLAYDQTFWGHGVGCWEGDTLTVTSMGYAGDHMWLDWPGYFATAEVVVVEEFKVSTNAEGAKRLCRTATVYDKVLLEPWTMNPNCGNQNGDRAAGLVEDVPYNDQSLGALFDPNYRG